MKTEQCYIVSFKWYRIEKETENLAGKQSSDVNFDIRMFQLIKTFSVVKTKKKRLRHCINPDFS